MSKSKVVDWLCGSSGENQSRFTEIQLKGKRAMARGSKSKLTTVYLGAVLLAGILPRCALGQLVQTLQNSSVLSQPQPVSLGHLYWHFLIHLNELDAQAASMEAQGGDGSWLRNHHQVALGFSDADFAVIRASSVRLSSELANLSVQAGAVRSAGLSAASPTQLNALAAQRDTAINAEVAHLKQTLPAGEIATLESYIVQFFSPKSGASQASPANAQATPAAVQQ